LTINYDTQDDFWAATPVKREPKPVKKETAENTETKTSTPKRERPAKKTEGEQQNQESATSEVSNNGENKRGPRARKERAPKEQRQASSDSDNSPKQREPQPTIKVFGGLGPSTKSWNVVSQNDVSSQTSAVFDFPKLGEKPVKQPKPQKPAAKVVPQPAAEKQATPAKTDARESHKREAEQDFEYAMEAPDEKRQRMDEEHESDEQEEEQTQSEQPQVNTVVENAQSEEVSAKEESPAVFQSPVLDSQTTENTDSPVNYAETTSQSLTNSLLQDEAALSS
jgi:hypothetical protein